RARGLPALTVNWGALGEVGHVARTVDVFERWNRFGVKAMPLSETLDVLDELMSSNSVQIVVAQLDWKKVSRAIMGSRISARFAGLTGGTNGEEGTPAGQSDVRVMLEAEESVLPALLQSYIRQHLARAMRASTARLDAQQLLANLGVDSLIATD